jgi:hypothetical protein
MSFQPHPQIILERASCRCRVVVSMGLNVVSIRSYSMSFIEVHFPQRYFLILLHFPRSQIVTIRWLVTLLDTTVTEAWKGAMVNNGYDVDLDALGRRTFSWFGVWTLYVIICRPAGAPTLKPLKLRRMWRARRRVARESEILSASPKQYEKSDNSKEYRADFNAWLSIYRNMVIIMRHRHQPIIRVPSSSQYWVFFWTHTLNMTPNLNMINEPLQHSVCILSLNRIYSSIYHRWR